MILLILAAALALLLPLRILADVHLGDRKLIRLTGSALGMHQTWLLELIATPEGHRLLVSREGASARSIAAGDMRNSLADRLLRRLWEQRHIRRFLLSHTHAEQLDGQLLLHTRSAAGTALLTGTAQTVTGLLPPRWKQVTRLRILPDFLRDRSTLQARCIFRLRLGTLLITACLLLADQVVQAINREVRTIWNTPSEN